MTEDNRRRLTLVLALTAGYALVQAVGGWWSGSLALVADAGHMVSDAAALALALIAYSMAARPADPRRSYGWHRVRVLAALANGAALIALVAWIAWEAVLRLAAPQPVLAGGMLGVAVVGLAVNVAGAAILMRGRQRDMNLRGAYLHVLRDLLGSVGAIAAALGILATGWTWLDPVLSLAVAALVLRSAWGLAAEAAAVLLQTTPPGFDEAAALAALRALPGVAEAGHLHAWTLTDAQVVATVHVTPAEGADLLDLPAQVSAALTAHGIGHATVQVERPGALGQHAG